MFRYGEAVEHHRFITGGVDRWGEPIAGLAAPVVVEGVAVDEGATGEQPPAAGGRVTVSTNLTLIFSTPIQVNAADQFTVRGERYTVQGEVIRPVNPWTGWAPGTTVTVKRVKNHGETSG